MKILFYIFFFPLLVAGQTNSPKDSVLLGNLGNLNERPVYFSVEVMPTLENGRNIDSYFLTQNYSIDSCCVFKAYLGFVIEKNGIISNKMTHVESLYCLSSGLIYEGNEIEQMKNKLMTIMDSLTILRPAQIGDKNVAMKYSIPIHVDCDNN